MALVLKICGSTWENDSQDKRELSVYRELGNEVCVLAKGNSEDKGRADVVDGFSVYRMSTRPLGNYVPKSVNRFISLFTWALYAKNLKPDIISGHDLLPGLTISWMVTIFSCKKPILIYDSHEFELGRTAKRSRLQVALIKWWEKLIMDKCAYMIVVNESIRNEIIRIQNPKTKLIVVRNIPAKWNVDENVCATIRRKIFDELAHESGYILMYHGAIAYGRGIEKCIDILEYDNELLLVIMGPSLDISYKKEIHERIQKKGLDGRVLIKDAVPQEELWKWIGAVDAEMVLIEPVGKSYYLSLPNKLFESILARTPIIASDLPEISRIINDYNVGITVDQNNIGDISAKVRYLKDNKKLQELIRENERVASEDLNWEKELCVLKDAFQDVMVSAYHGLQDL